MRSCIPILSLFLGAWISLAGAKEPGIVDRANFFSESAKQRASELIDQLWHKHHVEVRVETLASVPADKAESVKRMSSSERSEFFAEWLKELAKDRKAGGIFVLICREPPHMRMGVSKELHQRGFTDRERDAAIKPLIAGFKEKEYDRGLLDSLEVIRDSAGSLKSTTGLPVGSPSRTTAPTISPFSGTIGWIIAAVGGVLLLVLIIAALGSLFRGSGMAPGGYGGGYGGGGGWGGGMFGSLLAGLGGAMLGNWAYDQFSGRSAHAGYPEPTDPGYTRDDGYQDFISGGDDFGDSGGGDTGGGGDFGGGDSGGDGGGDF